MSATLTWHNSGLGTKTGTAVGDLFADLETLIDSVSADSNFSWEKASANVGSTPYQITLKPKSGGIGRILLLMYTSAPAGNNAAIFDAAPQNNTLYITYFPNGNVDTPSNLTASSGTIMGSDTNVVKCTGSMALSSIYQANYQTFYFDSAEALVFGFQNPAGSTCYMTGAGLLVVDANDDAYAATLRGALQSAHNFGNASNPLMAWQTSGPTTSSSPGHVLAHYGSNNTDFYNAWMPSGTWGIQTIGATDVLTDTSNSRAYFVPVPLLSRTKGQGFALKLRQIGYGPATTVAFSEYATTGPVTAARCFNANTTGGTGSPWFTNFKL